MQARTLEGWPVFDFDERLTHSPRHQINHNHDNHHHHHHPHHHHPRRTPFLHISPHYLALPHTPLPSLVADNNIGAAGMQSLAPSLLHLTALEQLYLSGKLHDDDF